MEWITVCASEELEDGLGVTALVNHRQVALFRTAGELFAVDNYDPFSKANVLSRGIVGDIQGRLVVASPVYKQHFDLETGECLEDGSVSIDTHRIREHHGMLQIALISETCQVA